MKKGSKKEVQNILDHDVLTPEHAKDYSELEMSKKVEMRVFAKLKRDKVTWKYRAPTGVGRYPQDRRDVNDTYSPTTRHASIVTGLKIALMENRKISTADIASAYLNDNLLLLGKDEKTEKGQRVTSCMRVAGHRTNVK